ncbi:IclR family transcriptional regulator [Roseomonas sp. CCTCC AB2023176]|uniref:IclR family transcriptional regulator n=1 Tax=Roseomonas sp. CCTCC AB2023176 TaxID=3342640 RepID=UPI0035E20759
MPSATSTEIATTHRIPAVDRAVDVLDALAAGAAGIRELAAQLGIPRSTVYRVLNSLEARSVVVRGADNAYRLGPHLLRLARAVPIGFDLVGAARPVMEALAAEQRCTVKLSVLDGADALVVATVESPESYSVTTQVGRRFPLHAGAASKVLAALGPPDARERALAGPLTAVTAATITDPAVLRSELDEVAARGWAEDRGEFADGVRAVAAPILGPDGRIAAALSVPYLMATPKARADGIRKAVVGAAAVLSNSIGGPASATGR